MLLLLLLLLMMMMLLVVRVLLLLLVVVVTHGRCQTHGHDVISVVEHGVVSLRPNLGETGDWNVWAVQGFRDGVQTGLEARVHLGLGHFA